MSNLSLSPDEKVERFGVRLNFYAEMFPLFETHFYQYYKKLWLQYAKIHLANEIHDKHADWNDDINIRHGINSIEGTECEMMAVLYYLTNRGLIVQATQDKKDQVSGIDLYLFHEKWMKSYSVSVKKRAHFGNQFDLRLTDFSKSSKIHRIAYVDPIANLVTEGSYWDFMRLCGDRDVRKTSLEEASTKVERFNSTKILGYPKIK